MMFPVPLQAASVVKMQIQALRHELAFGLQSITKSLCTKDQIQQEQMIEISCGKALIG